MFVLNLKVPKDSRSIGLKTDNGVLTTAAQPFKRPLIWVGLFNDDDRRKDPMLFVVVVDKTVPLQFNSTVASVVCKNHEENVQNIYIFNLITCVHAFTEYNDNSV